MGTWNYKVIHDYNGTQLVKEFRKEDLNLKYSKGSDDEAIDFIVYAEKDDFTISLGRVLLIKMSDAMIRYYYQYEGRVVLERHWAKYVYEQQKDKDTFHFKTDDLAKAFLAAINLQTKLVSDISTLDVENYIKRITDNISTFLHENLKFSREQWDPTLKSDKYLFANPNKAVNYYATKCNNLTKELNELKARLELIKSLNIIPAIEYLMNTIDYQIKSIQKFKNWLIANKDSIMLKISYICGVWNGLVELVAGIVDIILLAFNILIAALSNDGINLELLEIREAIEEILGAVAKEPLKIIDGAIDAIKQYKYSRYDDPKLNQYQLQHNEGEDTILAFDVVITIVMIVKGIAVLSKKLPKFTKWIDEVLKRNGKGALKVEEALQEARRTKKIIGVIEYEILSPNLLKKYIDDAIGICKRKGIKLEIKWIDKTHPEYNSDLLGRFDVNMKNKNIARLNLRPECPKITWFHEQKHLDDFLEMGHKKYKEIHLKTPWKHEQSVWDFIYKNRNKWSEAELADAYLYYQDYIRRKSLNKLDYIMKEMEELVPKYKK